MEHKQAPVTPDEPPTFTKTEFVGVVQGIRRLNYGGCVVSFVVEPQWLESVMHLWSANTMLSINVEPWAPYVDDNWDSDNDFSI